MRAIATGLLAVVAGCVDGFQGSNIEFDFATATPILASPSFAQPPAGELPSNTWFTLYAYQDSPDMTQGYLYAVQTFEIHSIVDLASPCFIDVDDTPFPGLHVSEYANMIGQAEGIPDVNNPPATATEAQKIAAATAVQREQDIQLLIGSTGIHAVTSASSTVYPAEGSDCADETSLPPPTCTDDASNERRLTMCQAAWHADPDHYEGTDRVLTQALNGTDHGMVDGVNPINESPVGGAGFYPTSNLVGFDGYAVYYQANNVTTPGGTLLLYGSPTEVTRGVQHVHMVSPGAGTLTAELAIFSNLGEDNEEF